MTINGYALFTVIALALVAVVGIAVGLDLAGATSADDVGRDAQLSSQARAAVPEPAPTPTPSPAPVNVPLKEPTVAPDPNFEAELRNVSISTNGWETDFSRHSVPYSEIFSGGVPRRRNSAVGPPQVYYD